MKMWKRAAAVLLALQLSIGGLTFPAPVILNVPEENVLAAGKEDRYFYNQLPDGAKKFYNAIKTMLDKGILTKGESLDLTEANTISQDQLKKYASGNQQLLYDMIAGRDAFEYDNPDVFWVDWSALSLRVGQMQDGTYIGYLGIGRSDTYFLPGFTSQSDVKKAQETYEAKLTSIVKQVKQAKDEDKDGDTVKEQVIAAHDYITQNMLYKFEYEVSNSKCNSRTAYDALIYGEGVCEAYTRGFKAILDRLGIPCVCIYGVYRSSDTVSGQHIWNAVKLSDGKWYGVDTTLDDPVNANWKKANSGHETHEFCLVGELDLLGHHMASGILSPGMDFEFTYPTLAQDAPKGKESYVNGDLIVKLLEDEYQDEEGTLKSGTICVSYRGKNYTENAKDGYYILSRYSQYSPKQDAWTEMEWAYITPQFYDVDGMEPQTPDPEMVPEAAKGDSTYGAGRYLKLPLPHVMRAQFAVTTIAPDLSEEGILNGSLYYKGDPALFTAVSEVIYNQWGTYVAPPYPSKVTPAMTSKLQIGKTYHVTVEYDDQLEKSQDGESFGIEFETRHASTGNFEDTSKSNTKITNATYYDVEKTAEEKATNHGGGSDKKTIVEFDFHPSEMYADDNTLYIINVKGLVGSWSGKKPVAVSFVAGYVSSYCSLGVGGFNWRVMGQPHLLDVSDIDVDKWETNDGSSFTDLDKITNRLMLISSEPSPAKTQELQEAMENAYGSGNVLKDSITAYNIQLTICKSCVINTGQSVRVCVGFPAGYSYETLGNVTFKAYHYKVDPKTNLLTGEVEEIECVVTPLGLIISCHSFSPFLIAAVKTDGSQSSEKTVILSSQENGSITDAKGNSLDASKGILTLKSSKDNRTVTIKPKKGYEIDAITVNGQKQLIDNITETSLLLDYDKLDRSTLISVSYVPASVHRQEEKKGIVNTSQMQSATITMPAGKLNIEPGTTLNIQPDVTLTGGDKHVYQWYRDGKKLSGQKQKDLQVEKVTEKASGSYTLKVTSYYGNTTYTTTSDPCAVTVAHTYGAWKAVGSKYCSDKKGKVRTCKICGYKDTKNINVNGHDWDIDAVTDKKATCTKAGSKSVHCLNCKAVKNAKVIPALGHDLDEVVTKKATLKANGKSKSVCWNCKKTISKDTIYKIKTINLSKTAYTYNGKARKPSVTVEDSKGNVVDTKYYKVTYAAGRKKVGTYTVTVKLKGRYTGSKKLSFVINPPVTDITKLTAGKKQFAVKWKKVTTQTTGYQLQYSTSQKFKGAKKKTGKKNSTKSTTVKGLKAKTTYYVRIRTYKSVKVNGKTKNYYSSWSKAKKIKTK